MRNIILFILSIIVVLGCEKENSSDTPVLIPKKAELVFPAQNEACTQGNVISSTESSINFVWKSTENAESYELNIRNLLTGSIISKSTSQTELEVSLSRNIPYSWY